MLRALICSILLFFDCYGSLFIDNPTAKTISKISQSKAPDWVVHRSYDSVHDPEKNEGKAILFQDVQVNLDTQETFFKEAYKLLNRSDILSFSDIRVTMDPETEELVLHEVNIIRNGKILERLSTSSIRIDSKQNESRFIFNNTQKVIIFLADLQPNDIVEYCFTRKDQTPIFHCDLFLSDHRFVKNLYYRVLSTIPCQIKNVLTQSQPIKKKVGKQIEYTWTFTNIEPTPKIEGAPSWYSNEPKIQIHATTSWKSISAYKRSETSPEQEDPSNELINLVKEIKDKNGLLEDQILGCYRYVTNHIFYRSLNPTNRAYKPNTVLKRGYGDCKDKTYLLIEMLKLLHVKAYPALVNTSKRHTIIDDYPITNFGHMITCIEFEGNLYFVDPTCENPGGRLKNIFLPDYGYALVLKPNTNKLTKLDQRAPIPKRIRQSFFEIDQDNNQAHLSIMHDYSSQAADIRRSFLIPGSEAYVINDWKKFLEEKFGEIQIVNPINTDDNLNENRIKSSCSFLISSFAKKEHSTIKYPLKPTTTLNSLQKIDPKRTAPYEIEKEIQEEIISLKFSKACPKEIEIPNIAYKDDYLDYRISWQKITENAIEIHLRFSILKDWIEAKDYPNFHDHVTQFEKALQMTLKEESEPL